MTQCPPLTSRTVEDDFITLENIDELITDTYDRTPGTEVNLQCFTGYKLDGMETIRCQSDGTWNYAVKPTCSIETEETGTDDGGIDDQAVIIGVVCAVAGLILIVLLIMCLIVNCWKRKLNADPRNEGLTKREIAMYARQHSQYNENHRDRSDPDRYSRDFDAYSRDFDGSQYAQWRSREPGQNWGSQLGYGMYLPRDPAESRPYGPYAPESRPYGPYAPGYAQPWASPGHLYGSNASMGKYDYPSVHGGVPDSSLWRSASSTSRY